MAQLTDQLTTINDGKPIINPGPEGPSWLAGLANFGGQVLGATLDRSDRMDARSRQDAQDLEARALDELAGGIQGLGSSSPVFGNPTDITLAIPSWEQGQLAERVSTILSAEEQGSINAARRDMEFETLVSEMFQRYPDARYEMSAMLQGMGIQHAGLRAETQRQEMLDADFDARRAAEVEAAQIAQRAGAVTQDQSLIEQARIGRGIMETQRQAALAQAQAEAAHADQTLEAEERDRLLSLSQDDMIASIGYSLTAQVNPWMDRMNGILSAAGSDPERQQLADQARTDTEIWLNTSRAEALQQIYSIGGPGVAARVEQVNQMFDQRITQMNSMFDGSFEQNTRSATNFAAAMGMEVDRVMPIYTAMVDALGSSAVNAMITDSATGTIAIPADILAGLQREITLYDPMNRDASARMARYIGYLRGQEGLQDLSPAEAREWFVGNTRAMLGNAAAFAAGDESVIPRWVPQYTNAVEAAVELSPATTDVTSLHMATGIVASPQARQMLAAVTDDEQRAALTQASRAGSQHLYQTARDRHTQGRGGWEIQYQGGVHRLVPPTRAEYEAFVAQTPQYYERPGPDGSVMVRRQIPTYDQFIRDAPQDLRNATDVLNGNLTHLAATRESEEWTRGLTERQYRDFVATGRLPEGFERPTETATSGDDQFRTEVQDFISDIRGARLEIATAPEPPAPQPSAPASGDLQVQVREAAESVGLDWDLVERLVRRESRWRPSARNGTTGAAGLFQINDDTPRSLDENIRDGLGMVREAQQGAQRVLGRAPSDAETYVMYQQGAGGGAALLNPQNASRSALEVLTAAYNGDERLARQAITANGGRVDMTAAEFARSIMNYFNG